jgi:hypothetical protein
VSQIRCHRVSTCQKEWNTIFYNEHWRHSHGQLKGFDRQGLYGLARDIKRLGSTVIQDSYPDASLTNRCRDEPDWYSTERDIQRLDLWQLALPSNKAVAVLLLISKAVGRIYNRIRS